MKNMGKLGFSNYAASKDGTIYSLISKRILKGTVCSYGYLVYTLKNDKGKAKKMKAHRLLAMMFLEGDFELHINHKDGNKLNNDLSNLEWCTIAENNSHAIDIGIDNRHAPHNKIVNPSKFVHNYKDKGRRFLTEDDVHYICQMAEEGYRTCDISSMTGIDFITISCIFRGGHPTKNSIIEQYDLNKVLKAQKLSPEKVLSICNDLMKGYSFNSVAKIHKKSSQTISNIYHKKTYKNLTASYKFPEIEQQ